MFPVQRLGYGDIKHHIYEDLDKALDVINNANAWTTTIIEHMDIARNGEVTILFRKQSASFKEKGYRLTDGTISMTLEKFKEIKAQDIPIILRDQ